MRDDPSRNQKTGPVIQPGWATPGARPDELVRWRETSMDPSALPARAADLVDAARDAPGLPPVALMRIFDDVVGGARPARSRGVPLGLRLATLMALLLVSVATAKGAMVLWQRYVAPRIVPIEPVEPRPTHAAPRAHVASATPPRARVETAPVIETIEAPEPARVAAPTRTRHAAEHHAAGAATASLAPAASALPVDSVNEAQLLADALARLRQARDPSGALDLLDKYAQTYPHGVLASESRSARIEALLKLDDRAGALELLDERTTFAGRLGAEQLLTRAELRASVGRYADALRDFDRVLGPTGALPAQAGAAQERALYGRAVTLGHLGRDERARQDLEAYLRRFPTGKYAVEVARLLDGAPSRASSNGRDVRP